MRVILLALLLLLPCHVHAFTQYNKVAKYDRYFSKYTKRFFGPMFDWRYFKAQAVAESGLDATAQSHVGAVGVMQIMPSTYQEILQNNPIIQGASESPHWNIAAGIYYNRTLWNIWQAKRPFKDRLNFMFGSFNAGKSNILKAQTIAKRKGLNENVWQSIVQTLPAVTGRHSRETIGYVKKIHTIKQVLR